MIALPGGSFLFVWPVIIAAFSGIGFALLPQSRGGSLAKNLINFLTVALPIILFAPIIYIMYLALTIGALGVIMLLTMIPLAIIVPSAMQYLYKTETMFSKKTQEISV